MTGGHRLGIARGSTSGSAGDSSVQTAAYPPGWPYGTALNGRYEGAELSGPGEAPAAAAWMDEHGGAADRLWAYGNSRGDLSMLGGADVGVDVGRLGPFGKLRSFPLATAYSHPSA